MPTVLLMNIHQIEIREGLHGMPSMMDSSYNELVAYKNESFKSDGNHLTGSFYSQVRNNIEFVFGSDGIKMR